MFQLHQTLLETPLGMSSHRHGRGRRDPFDGLVGFSDADVDTSIGDDNGVGKESHQSRHGGPRVTRYFLPDATPTSPSLSSSTTTTAPPHYDAPDGRRWVSELVMQRARSSEVCTHAGFVQQRGQSATRVPELSPQSAFVGCGDNFDDNNGGGGSNGDGCDDDAAIVGVDPTFARLNTSTTDLTNYLEWLVSSDVWALDPHHTEQPSRVLAQHEQLQTAPANGNGASGREEHPSPGREDVPPAMRHSYSDGSSASDGLRHNHHHEDDDNDSVSQVLRTLYGHELKRLRTRRQLRDFLRAGYKKPATSAHSNFVEVYGYYYPCLLYTSPSPRDRG